MSVSIQLAIIKNVVPQVALDGSQHCTHSTYTYIVYIYMHVYISDPLSW